MKTTVLTLVILGIQVWVPYASVAAVAPFGSRASVQDSAALEYRVQALTFTGLLAIAIDDETSSAFPRTGDPLDMNRLGRSCDDLRIRLYNAGYLHATVKPKIAYDGSYASVTIAVVEGGQFVIESISIRGATLYSEPELKEIYGLKVGDIAVWGGMISGRERIRDVYTSQGYIRVDIGARHEAPDKRDDAHVLSIDMTVTEGAQYVTGEVTFVGFGDPSILLLRRTIEEKVGQPFNERRFWRSIEALSREMGISFVDGESVIVTPDPETHRVDVTIHSRSQHKAPPRTARSN